MLHVSEAASKKKKKSGFLTNQYQGTRLCLKLLEMVSLL